MLVLRGDGPCAVGIIGVAVREPWALHCPIGALQLECAVLAWKRKRKQFSVARRTPRSFQEVGILSKRTSHQSLFQVLPMGCPGLGSQGRKTESSLLGRGGALCSVILKLGDSLQPPLLPEVLYSLVSLPPSLENTNHQRICPMLPSFLLHPNGVVGVTYFLAL